MLKLFRRLGPYAPSIAAVLVLVFAQSIADLSLPTLMSDIVDEGIATGDIPFIWRTGGWMLLLALAGIATNLVGGYLASRAALGFGRELRSSIFRRVTSWSLDGIDRFGAASLITRTTNDVTQVQQVLFMMLRMMAMAPIMAIGGLIMAVSKEPELAWMLAVAIPVLVAAIAAIAAKGLPLFTTIQRKLDTLNRVLREKLSGIRVIRAFDRVAYEQGRFEDANRELTEVTLKVNRLVSLLFPFVMLVMNLTTIAIVWFGGLAIDSGGVKIGSLMAFIQYSMQIMFSVVMVSVIFIMVPRASASALRINEVLETGDSILDPDRPAAPPARSGRVEFRNVDFGYPGAEEMALRGVSFVAEEGKVTAIIGSTGSGKTTVLNLIERFHDVSSGAVLVDGVDVREYRQAELRARLGYAPQKAMLFSGSVADNLRFGADAADDAALRRALSVAQAVDFVDGMEGGLGAAVTQGGTNVSGGQRQRLAVARAVARDPSIYLFDDTFSALDARTDARLREALKAETAGSTVIMVVQRVGTIVDADRIVVLDEGRVAGIGTHAELLAGNEVYREIVQSQLSAEVEA
ncbi:MAG TPA: ABC transporter ATP-binding protein [Spirochaetales bacterium]|nr:ABC transporter ATP-binding protein [Spirochaetales bacterium]